MIEIAKRLERGSDLKASIIELLKDNDVNTACILSSVGCLSEVKLRLAGAKSTLHKIGDYEIVSLNGTYSCGKAHLHISVADTQGEVIGGHMLEGCIVNTTCELIMGVLSEYSSHRVFDPMTGYEEILFEKSN